MPSILVTGADGFFGKEVIGILKKNNFDCVGVSRKNTGVNYVFFDSSMPNNVLRLLEKKDPMSSLILRQVLILKKERKK